MDEWLTRIRDTIAEIANIPQTELQVDHEGELALLDVARIAAHESGERINAPLLCYLIGRAERGAPLDVLANAVRGASTQR